MGPNGMGKMIVFFMNLLARKGIGGIRALLIYAFIVFCVFIAWLVWTFGTAR